MIFGPTKKEAASKVAPRLGAKNGSTPPPSTATNATTVARPTVTRRRRPAIADGADVCANRGRAHARSRLQEPQALRPGVAGASPSDGRPIPARRMPQGRRPQSSRMPARRSRVASSFRSRWRCGRACRPRSTRLCRKISTSKCGCAPTSGPPATTCGSMAAAGHPRAVPEFLKQLQENEFKGKQVKMRLRGSDGKAVVKTCGSIRIGSQ